MAAKNDAGHPSDPRIGIRQRVDENRLQFRCRHFLSRDDVEGEDRQEAAIGALVVGALEEWLQGGIAIDRTGNHARGEVIEHVACSLELVFASASAVLEQPTDHNRFPACPPMLHARERTCLRRTALELRYKSVQSGWGVYVQQGGRAYLAVNSVTALNQFESGRQGELLAQFRQMP